MKPLLALIQQLRDWHSQPDLLPVPVLEELVQSCRKVLVREPDSLRPRDSFHLPGGFLELHQDIPTVLVPDLHGRTGFPLSLLAMPWEGKTLGEALARGKLQVVCVGDGLHSEARGRGRWERAWGEYTQNFRRHSAMDQEMKEGLALMAMVMLLKINFPGHFHFLKGNHENIQNSDQGGNKPFRKYVQEGVMVREWFSRFLGLSLLEQWAAFEGELPLFARGNYFLVSHAQPRRVYTRQEIIEYRKAPEVVYGLTWTPNGGAQEASVPGMLETHLGKDFPGALYFGGHRPVEGLYATRAQDLYVQFHNPGHFGVAVLSPGVPPHPPRDVVALDPL